MATTDSPVRELTDGLVQEIARRFRPNRIILFGSFAYGKPHRDSDLDLLIVTDPSPSRAEALRFARELSEQSPLPLQTVFMPSQAFEETKDVVGGLAYPAHHWGQTLYVKDT